MSGYFFNIGRLAALGFFFAATSASISSAEGICDALTAAKAASETDEITVSVGGFVIDFYADEGDDDDAFLTLNDKEECEESVDIYPPEDWEIPGDCPVGSLASATGKLDLKLFAEEDYLLIDVDSVSCGESDSDICNAWAEAANAVSSNDEVYVQVRGIVLSRHDDEGRLTLFD